MKLSKNQKILRRRLLTIINDVHTSHIGSCLSVIDIIDAVFSIKDKKDRFVLSNGHAAAAYYVILEKYGYIKNANLEKMCVHPDRCVKNNIEVSTGSLGQGLPIAVGMALANKNKNIYCIISDGECAEGSIWESLRLVYELNINNLFIIASINGWGAYDPISSKNLENRFKGFGFKIDKIDGHNTKEIIIKLKTKMINPTIYFAKTSSEQFKFLNGLDAHYYTMKDTDYELAMEELK